MLSNCKNQNDKTVQLNNTNLLKLTDTIKISHPIKEKKIKKYIRYYESSKIGNCCLVKYSSKSDSLSFYNLKGQELSVGINLSNVAKRNLQHFVVHSKDSIFILNYNNKLFKLNSDGEINNKWNFNGNVLDNGNKNYTIMGAVSSPISYKNNYFYAIQARNVKGLGKNIESNQKYYYSNSGIKIRLKKDSFKLYNKIGKYPWIYKKSKKFYYEFHPSKTLGHNNHVVFSFALSDTIYAYKRNKLRRKVSVSSPFFKTPNAFNKDSMHNYKYISKYISTQPRYKMISYDKYNNLYYRIIAHTQPYKNEDGTINKVFDRPWSIMVLDTNFKKLHEIIMPAGKFEYNTIFVTEKGILLKANERTKAARPNRMTYYLVEVNS